MYYLYLFKFIDTTDSSLWFKIGITNKIERRMKEIFKDLNSHSQQQTIQGPLDLQYVSADIDRKTMEKIEQSALKLFPAEDYDAREKSTGSTEMRLLRKDGKKYRRYKHVREAFNTACKYAEYRGIEITRHNCGGMLSGRMRGCNIM